MKIKIPPGRCTLCYTVPILDFDGKLRCECGHVMDPADFPRGDPVHKAVEQAKAIRDEEGQRHD